MQHVVLLPLTSAEAGTSRCGSPSGGAGALSRLYLDLAMGILGAEGTLAAELPAEFADAEWVGERFPGAPGVSGIDGGANCQLYAYAVLAHFGLTVPPVRSSELWTDPRLATVRSDERPLDLVLYGPNADPYGAHVGVIVGDDAVLHLCAELNRPAVWPEREFARRERYGCRIGVCRCVPALA